MPDNTTLNEPLSGSDQTLWLLNSEFTSKGVLLGVEFYLAESGIVNVEVSLWLLAQFEILYSLSNILNVLRSHHLTLKIQILR